jgi:hemolysin activation/secretion protein
MVPAHQRLDRVDQTRMGVLARAGRIALARMGYYAYAPFGGGTLQTRLTQTQGLGILGATRRGDALASRSDAPADFTTLSFWMNWRRPLAKQVSLQLAATGQLSLTPLLIGETFSLGGSNVLRSYDFAQAVGDQGVAGLAELRYDMPKALGALKNLQPYAFADGGLVSSLPSGSGYTSLASSGGGCALTSSAIATSISKSPCR